MITLSVMSIPMIIPIPIQNNMNPKNLPISEPRLSGLYYSMQIKSLNESFICLFQQFLHFLLIFQILMQSGQQNPVPYLELW